MQQRNRQTITSKGFGNMRVLGIDPGYDRVGIAIMEKQNGTERVLHSECFLTDKADDIAARLMCVGERVSTIIAQYEPNVVALESLYFNKNQKTAVAVAEARGVLLFLAYSHNCTIFEYTPQQIKVAVTGHGQSSKRQVMDMVTRLTGFSKKDVLDDEYDAIAVGITCLACEHPHIPERA